MGAWISKSTNYQASREKNRKSKVPKQNPTHTLHTRDEMMIETTSLTRSTVLEMIPTNGKDFDCGSLPKQMK